MSASVSAFGTSTPRSLESTSFVETDGGFGSLAAAALVVFLSGVFLALAFVAGSLVAGAFFAGVFFSVGFFLDFVILPIVPPCES